MLAAAANPNRRPKEMRIDAGGHRISAIESNIP
jgi:hypothetical protein